MKCCIMSFGMYCQFVGKRRHHNRTAHQRIKHGVLKRDAEWLQRKYVKKKENVMQELIINGECIYWTGWKLSDSGDWMGQFFKLVGGEKVLLKTMKVAMEDVLPIRR